MTAIIKVTLFLTVAQLCFGFPTNISQDAEKSFVENVYGHMNHEDHTVFMKKVRDLAGNDTNAELNMLLPYKNTASLGTLKCTGCKVALDYALWKYRKPDGTYDGLPEFVRSACKRFKIESDAVCDGIVKVYKNVVLTLLHDLQLSAEQVCGLILPSTCFAPDLSWNKLNWTVPIPGIVAKNSSHPRPQNDHPKSTLRVLHISDVHIDLNYTPGAPVDCSDPLCCRATNKMKSGSRLAGYWGSVGYCDTPYWTVENFLQHASRNSYDYILWTGDLPAHNDWDQKKDAQIDALYNLTSLFLKYFPKTPFYPSLGNHESFPVNNFPPGYVKDKNSISWLYDALRKAWSPWLTDDALKTVSESGYYTILVKPKFRIISMNMNYCNQQNWWMLINPVDPNHELQWLVSVLLEAEKSGEKVHILGHIPPGSYDCLPIWSQNYYRIINRFKDTITAQFFGHTHSDQFEIFYDEKTKKIPTNIAYIAPSITTYFNMHPGYREYFIEGFYDGSNWDILDHSTYILNLTDANTPPFNKTNWEILYSAKDAFNLKDLSLESWNNLVNFWINSKNAKANASFQKYYHYFYKNNPPKPICDVSCKKAMLCDIRSARSGDSKDFCS